MKQHSIVEKTDQPVLLGAVTTGELWMFGQLHRGDRLVMQSTKSFLVPDEVEAVMRILVEALRNEEVRI